MSTSRRFVDAAGNSWQVFEIEDQRPIADRANVAVDRWLYFTARHDTRKRASFPADWQSCSWEELERLCADALSVASPPPRPGSPATPLAAPAQSLPELRDA